MLVYSSVQTATSRYLSLSLLSPQSGGKSQLPPQREPRRLPPQAAELHRGAAVGAAGALFIHFIKKELFLSMEQPKLYMICGISGSGKTFYAKKLERQGVVRLSIDEELWPDFFILDPLLCAEHKAMLKEQAEARIKSRAANLIAAGRDVSIDMPFCRRAQRDEFRAFAREHGACLLYTSPSPRD